ncbi:MAG: hypothetical protein DSZ28_08545 [Thiothrix sp.]|nr:MAG: hypothetical protein DSZ28_08545 [Thiothrix sp.]
MHGIKNYGLVEQVDVDNVKVYQLFGNNRTASLEVNFMGSCMEHKNVNFAPLRTRQGSMWNQKGDW